MKLLHLCSWIVPVVLMTLLFSIARGQQPQEIRQRVPGERFAYVDVMIDPGEKPLAAYQFEFTASPGTKIVGLEGGEHPAFKSAPFYDPAALSQRRVIAAAYHTGDFLPSARSRVARIHVQTSEKIDPHIKLIVAGSTDGKSIPATLTLREGAAQ